MSENGAERTRVAIVGSGFGGLGAAIRLRQCGIDDLVVLERSDAIGGTWRDNRYPGCACDVPSHLYSYSFAPNPDWSRSYSPQPEIRRYLEDCADRFGVRERVRLRHEVHAARWDDARQLWRLETSGGALEAELLVAATGALSEPHVPPIPGLERFRGPVLHSGAWDEAAELAGLRVASIGTGASAIQIVPELQPRVERLYVFQRTPAWIVPRRDRAITPLERRLFRAAPAAQRLVRGLIYLSRELFVPPLMRPWLARLLERWVRAQLEREIPDAALRERLTPDYAFGCKRVLISSDFYPALLQPNAELVTAPIAAIGESAIATADGTEREVDAIVLGTGFRASEWPFAARLHGRDGVSLAEVWRRGAQAYLGMTVAGFPNLFVLYGPNTNLGHNSIVYMLESQIAYLADALRAMDAAGVGSVEVREEAQRAHNAWLDRRLAGSVWNSGGCSSWYLDRSGRNSLMWPGTTLAYRRRTRRFDVASYRCRARAASPRLAPALG